jgi:hypothetical protein
LPVDGFKLYASSITNTLPSARVRIPLVIDSDVPNTEPMKSLAFLIITSPLERSPNSVSICAYNTATVVLPN